MSIRIPVDQLGAEIERRGPACFVVTVGADGAPKVHHGSVAWHDGSIVAEVGGGTARNATERPAVTLLWPAPDDDPGQLHLLVDAHCSAADPDADEPTITVEPASAIRHRVVGDAHACR